MAFYATYSPSSSSSTTVTALQGTTPWIVAGQGTAGTPATGVVTVQGITGGDPIEITGSITADNDSVGATGAAVPASATYIGMTLSGNLTGLVGTADGLKVDGSAVTQPVSGTVAATQSGAWNIDDITGTVSLPTGASTEAKQDTQITSLSAIAVSDASIDTKTPALGQALMAASVPVVIASDQTAIPITGTATVSGTVAATQSGTWTVQPGNTANTTAWKVDGSAVTQPVSVATTTATFQAEGSIAFGALTGSYATIFTPAAATKILQLRNNTNAAVSVSFDAGSTLNYVLDAGDQVSLDLKGNTLAMTTTNIQVKYTVGAPTSGSVRVNGCS